MKGVRSTYRTALYMRLSKEDEGTNESSSISTQKRMLEAYAQDNGFEIYDEYIDDGYSGTNFDRPAFKRMIRDIEDGQIDIVITKDLSRLGREYITTGQYTEIYFPEHSVRYIAINDGYDSDNDFNDLAPFKNVINEMYARDISKKIKSALNTKMREGKYIANFAPYGYIKSPDDKNKLMPDIVASITVREIFRMAANGMTPKRIVDELNSRNIMPPSVYRCHVNPNLNINNYSKHKAWTSSTVTKILKNIVYLGHTAQGKTDKLSIKSKNTIRSPRSEWIVVYNTHEPLVDMYTFDLANQYRMMRRSNSNNTYTNVFAGIAKCGDCGKSMSITVSRKKGSVKNLVCGGYKLYGAKACTNHFIDYDELYDIVLDDIRDKFKALKFDDNTRIEITKTLDRLYDEYNQSKGALQNDIARVDRLRKRIDEIDIVVKRLYDELVFGRLENDRFETLLKQYEDEQRNLRAILKTNTYHNETASNDNNIRGEIKAQDVNRLNMEELLDDLLNINELTSDVLCKLIDRIEICQGEYIKPEYGRPKKQQRIRIYYKFIV